MAYRTLYLKYRPQTFSEVIGQDHICQTLQNALRASRVAHAYLFCGPRGTGKTTTARILAKALNCEKGPTAEPCLTCTACTQIRDGTLLDVVEIDAASNTGVDNIRDLKEILGFAPSWGRYKVFIIDEVHMLSASAWNALLKTLEEPPDHVYFVLATTDPQKVLPTILSRCQRFDFHRVPTAIIAQHLSKIAQAEEIAIEESAIHTIARLAQGCVRDGITILDQVAAYAEGSISATDVHAVAGGIDRLAVFDLTDALVARDAAAALSLVDRLGLEGADFGQILNALTVHLRDLLLSKVGAASPHTVELAEADFQRLDQQARHFADAQIAAMIRALARASEELRWNHNRRIVLEVALIDLLQMLEEEGNGQGETGNRQQATGNRKAAPQATAAASTTALPPQHRAARSSQPAAEVEGGGANSRGGDAVAPISGIGHLASDQWQSAVVRLAQALPSVGAALSRTVASREGSTLLVRFLGNGQKAVFEAAWRDRSKRKVIEQIVADIYGSGLEVRWESVEEWEVAPPPDAEASGEASSSGEELLDLILDTFPGSRVIEQ